MVTGRDLEYSLILALSAELTESLMGSKRMTWRCPAIMPYSSTHCPNQTKIAYKEHVDGCLLVLILEVVDIGSGM
jgi:hypothetical protein